MRKYLLLLMLPMLTACLEQGGSSSSKISLNLDDSGTTTTTTLPVTTTTQAPASYSSLNGITVSNAYGDVRFDSGRIYDARCGYNYPIDSSSVSGNVITVQSTWGSASDYILPLSSDCELRPDQNYYGWNAAGGTCGNYVTSTPSNVLLTKQITYTITPISGGYSIERSFKSITYYVACSANVPSNPFNILDSMPAESYYE